MATEIAKMSDFAKDVAVFLSPSSRQKEIAAYAVGALAAAQVVNRSALGRFPSFQTTVDGRVGAPLTSVDPSHGVIEFDFDFLDPAALRWIASQLQFYSPRLTGRYASSHVILADGVLIDVSASGTPPARQYVFLNSQPYARKIDRGASSQASEGVYILVAKLAQQQFPNLNIKFGFANGDASSSARGASIRYGGRRRSADWLSRQPAIIVTDA